MPVDQHKNLAYSTIVTPPSPADSGTSLLLVTGQSSRMPSTPFNATIWPAGQVPTPSNAEIVRVTNVSVDTLTVQRAQEGTGAISLAAGYQIVAGITAKTFTDIEAMIVGAVFPSTAFTGSLVFGTAVSKIVPGATSFSIMNNANSLSHFNITDAGIISMTPDSGTLSVGVQVGGGANTYSVADAGTTMQMRLSGNFTAVGASAGSVRTITTEPHWTDNTRGIATFAGGYFFAYHDGVGTDCADLFGVIGRAYITSTGTSNTGFWGARGDFNFTGAGSALKAVAVYGHAGTQFVGSSITTAAMLCGDSINWNVTAVQDAYGALIGTPSSATRHNIGVSIGPPLASPAAYIQGLVVWGGGATIKGSGTLPFADVGNFPTQLFLQAGDNAAANNTNCLIYFYRGATSLGYFGYDTDVSSVMAGHTKSLTDFVLRGSKLVMDVNGQLFCSNSFFVNGLSIIPVAITGGANLPTTYLYTAATHGASTGMNQTSSAEFNYNFAATVTYDASGTGIATLYAFQIQKRTYAALAAMTVAQAATFRVTGAPTAGTNVTITIANAVQVDAGNIWLGSGVNFVLNTTTGTKIGTVGGAAGQKLGFFGATAVVQPLLATGAGATADNIITALQTLGLVRQS